MPLPSIARERGPTKGGEHSSNLTLWERIFGRSKHQQILLRLNSVLVELDDTKRKVEQIMATLAELEGILANVDTALVDVGSKLEEGFREVVAEIASLREQLNTVQLPAGAQARLDGITAKVAALQTAAASIADIIPNAPAPEPPPVV